MAYIYFAVGRSGKELFEFCYITDVKKITKKPDMADNTVLYVKVHFKMTAAGSQAVYHIVTGRLSEIPFPRGIFFIAQRTDSGNIGVGITL